MINIVILLCSIFLSISSDVRGHEYIQLIEPHQERVLPFPPKPFPLLKSHSLDERKLSLNERRPGIEIGDFFISKTPSTPTWSAYDQENSYEQRNTLEIQENLEKLKSSEQIYYFGEEPLTVNINLPEKSYDEESYDKDYGVFRKNKEIFRVLSLDGGGIRGVIAATILAEVEKRTEKRIYEHFNIAAGTSTGGILAIGLTSRHPDAEEYIPAFRAVEMKDMYQKKAKKIFKYDRYSAYGFNSARYSNDYLTKIGLKYLKDNTLDDLLTDVYIPAYEPSRCQPFGFCRELLARTENFYVRDIVLATSAAPTYFPPVQIWSNPGAPQEERSAYSFTDGGTFCNNPSMAALTYAYGRTGINNIQLISIGTGSSSHPIHHEDAVKFGFVGWGKNMVNIFMDGQSKEAHYQAQQVLGKELYLRFQAQLVPKNEAMDNTDPSNIEDLIYKAEEIIRSDEFTKFIENLEDHPKANLSADHTSMN